MEAPPVTTHRVRYEPMGLEVEVDPAKAPFEHHGKPCSLLDIALANGLEIEHSCGGVAACSTCHVIVKEGTENLSPSTEREEDMLDLAEGLTPTSRLACQAVVKGDVVVEVPGYHRNKPF